MESKWKETLVDDSSSLGEVISVIDRVGLQIALVHDARGALVGTVTDGDVRRAFLKGHTAEEPVINVMGKEPTVAQLNDSEEKVREMMLDNELEHIPLVDDDGSLRGLYLLRDLVSGRANYDNPVFIMAGGFGTRLKPLTDDCPKPLLKVGDRPMLEHILDQFRRHGFWNFHISVHYLGDMIRDYCGTGDQWNCQIQYVEESDPLGTAGALGLLPPHLGEAPLIMINGDVLTQLNFAALLKFHQENEADVSIGVREYDFEIPYGVVETDSGVVSDIVEKPIHSFYVNAGIYVVGADVRKSVETGCRIDMPDLIRKVIDNGGKVISYPIYEYWLDIGRTQDFEKAQSDIARLLSD